MRSLATAAAAAPALIGLLYQSRTVSGLKDYDPELYINDERAQIQTMYTSTTGMVIPMVSGSLSAISSMITIYLINKSWKKLTTVYHRIMFALSLCDIIMSVAIALASLPLPKDMIYQFQNIVLGNTATCSAQGFFFIFGATATSGYNASLMIYYLCSIRYRMTEHKITKHVEPWLHFVSVSYSLGLTVPLLIFDTFNPTPVDAWCTANVYPWWCSGNQDSEACFIRGDKRSFHIKNVMAIGFVLIAMNLVYCLVVVIGTVCSRERLFVQYTRQTFTMRRSGAELDRIGRMYDDDLHYTKIILKQAAGYVLAYAIVNIFPILSILSTRARATNNVISTLHLIIRPQQGTLNLFIFLYHKVHNLRNENPDLSTCDAIREVFVGTNEPERIISTLHIVKRDAVDQNSLHIVDVSVPSVIPGDSDREDPSFQPSQSNRMGSSFELSSGPGGMSPDSIAAGALDSFDDEQGISYGSSGPRLSTNDSGVSYFSRAVSAMANASHK